MRERGLKCLILSNPCIKSAGRSREGAWIEIGHHQETNQSTKVAPVRERGLKLLLAALLRLPIVVAPVRERGLKFPTSGQKKKLEGVAPVRERGLKSLWIC